MSDADLIDILERTKSVAVVGASDNPTRPSFEIGAYLLAHTPYDVYFINPGTDSILGRPAYASLADLPVVPDLVDVFRRDEFLPGVAREAADVGAKTLWLQLGLRNEEAAAIAEEAGLDVVMDRCILIEHRRLRGRLSDPETGSTSQA